MTEAEKWREVGRIFAEAFLEGISRAFDPIRWRFGMTEAEAKSIIVDDPGGNIARRLEALEVAYYILGDDCTMEDIWRWAEGNAEEVTMRVKTCFECTEYVDIDGEQPRCGLDRDPLKCDRKVHGRKKESAI